MALAPIAAVAVSAAPAQQTDAVALFQKELRADDVVGDDSTGIEATSGDVRVYTHSEIKHLIRQSRLLYATRVDFFRFIH